MPLVPSMERPAPQGREIEALKLGSRLIFTPLDRSKSMSNYDPDEIHPTPAHLRLLDHAVPPPGQALDSAAEESGLPLHWDALWVVHGGGYLGRPASTNTIVLADEHDDVRLLFRQREQLILAEA